MLDFENIMKDRGYWDDRRWVKTPKPTYTFETGSKIEFLSVDTYGKAHGPRRDVLFLNECNNIPYLIVDQLITRTRKVVWMDWNPINEFWFYTDMQPNRKDIDFLTLTYLDNEAIDEGTLNEILAHKDNKNWWQVYALGQLGEIESRIYKNWKIIDEVPHEAKLERTGVDFGYYADPTVIVDVYAYDGGYIWDEVLYQRGTVENKKIADVLLSKPEQALAKGDRSESRSIDEIRSYGVMIMPSFGGKGSVNSGISFIQAQKISVTKHSVNIIKEYRNYIWLTDKDGRIINEDDHMYSHSMDAGRYAMEDMYNLTRNNEQEQAERRLSRLKQEKAGLR